MTRVPEANYSDPPWRYRCPKGHSWIVQDRTGGTYRCRSCEEVYEGPPVDLASD